MTNQQKEAVLQLRSKGLGYTEIARQLGLSVNTLKSFGRRYGVPSLYRVSGIEAGEQQPNLNGCKQCSAALIQTPHRRKKSFCSDRCRYAWWMHNRALSQSATPNKCPSCGKLFVARNSQRYCSHTCYVTARFGGQQHGKAHNRNGDSAMRNDNPNHLRAHAI